MLTKLLNKKVKIEGGYSDEEIQLAEDKLGFEMPSDLISVFKQTKKIVFEKSGYEITLDKVNKWIEFGEFHDLEWLVKERYNDLKNDCYQFQNAYLQIGNTFGQDLVLIGILKENMNCIYFYSEEDELTKLSDSIYEFINEHLL